MKKCEDEKTTGLKTSLRVLNSNLREILHVFLNTVWRAEMIDGSKKEIRGSSWEKDIGTRYARPWKSIYVYDLEEPIAIMLSWGSQEKGRYGHVIGLDQENIGERLDGALKILEREGAILADLPASGGHPEFK